MTGEAEAGDTGAGNAQGHQEPEEAGRTLPQSLQRERGPAKTSTLDFWPPELWESRVLLF